MRRHDQRGHLLLGMELLRSAWRRHDDEPGYARARRVVRCWIEESDIAASPESTQGSLGIEAVGRLRAYQVRSITWGRWGGTEILD